MAENPASYSPSQAVHSCSSCRRRKTRCDKATPTCGPCSKRSVTCNYPTTVARYSVSRAKSCLRCQSRRMRCNRAKPCHGCEELSAECVYETGPTTSSTKTTAPTTDHAASSPRASVGSSNGFLTSLLFGDNGDDDGGRSHPSTGQIWTLFHIYAENVDPLIKLFHLPSCQKQLLQAVEDLEHVQPDFETLLFAVYFAAVVSLSDKNCLERLRAEKSSLLARYQARLEKSLRNLNFFSRPSFVALQAFVLYLITVRHAPITAPIDVLHAAAVRLAMKLDIHKEPLGAPERQSGSFTTIADRTSVEMRRRLWWHILSLDVQIAEEIGSDPALWEGMWVCRLPSNVDDVELDAVSSLPLPPRAGEIFDANTYQMQQQTDSIDAFLGSFDRRTDMSYALLRIEMSYAMRQYGFSETFCRANHYQYCATIGEKLQFLEKHMSSIDQRYLQFCNRNDMFSFFQRNAVKLILSRHVMMTKKDGDVKEVMHNAIMVLEAAVSMRKTHKRWAWSLRSYVELDALELLWMCLARSATSSDAAVTAAPFVEEAQHGWALADLAFTRGEEDRLERCYGDKWSRIKGWRDEAVTSRNSYSATLTYTQITP